MKPAIRDILKRYPKLRGYRFKSREEHIATITLGDLERNFERVEKVTPEALVDKRVVRRLRGRIPAIKILAGGRITKPLIIEKCMASSTAKEKIEKAGGKINP